MDSRGRAIIVMCGLAVLCCRGAVAEDNTSLSQLYRRHDVFQLKDRLARNTGTDGAQLLFLRGAVLAAFGREEDSSAILRKLLSRPVKSDTELHARTLLMLDERALFRYRAALAALPVADRRGTALANRARLLEAIADVSPQTIARGPMLSLRTATTRVRIGSRSFPFLVDTAASFSALSRSVARAAGLRVHSVGYEIEAVGGGRLRTDVAMGDLAVAGGGQLRNVIFLVLPDAAFAAPGSPPFAGVIGIPVLRQLGSIHIAGIGRPRAEVDAPLAFVETVPVVEAAFGGRRLLCRLDTGANRSSFGAGFGRRFAGNVSAQRGLVFVTAADGRRKMALYETPITIAIAGRPIALPRAMIFARPEGKDALGCTLGFDAFAAAGSATLDFDRMRLMMR